MTKTILVIEDDELLREIYATKFSLEGFDVDTATDGLAGLEKATHHQPHVILLDMIMPRMTGLEFLRTYQPTRLTPQITTIIMSNRSSTQEIAQAKALGVADYLIKSRYTPDDIVSRVRSYLEIP
jgi:CheY-like chemotaxis protein